MAEDIYEPNFMRNDALNQYFRSTRQLSGKAPRKSILQDIIGTEVDRAAANWRAANAQRIQQQQFNTTFGENQRQFNIGQQNAMDTAAAQRSQSWIAPAAQIGSTYLIANALRPSTTPTGAGEGIVSKLTAPVKNLWNKAFPGQTEVPVDQFPNIQPTAVTATGYTDVTAPGSPIETGVPVAPQTLPDPNLPQVGAPQTMSEAAADYVATHPYGYPEPGLPGTPPPITPPTTPTGPVGSAAGAVNVAGETAVPGGGAVNVAGQTTVPTGPFTEAELALGSAEAGGLEAGSVAGSAALEGGATLGSGISAVMPYSWIPLAAQVAGMGWEAAAGGPEANNLGARFGRTLQQPYAGPGRATIAELFGMKKDDLGAPGAFVELLNPAGSVYEDLTGGEANRGLLNLATGGTFGFISSIFGWG